MNQLGPKIVGYDVRIFFNNGRPPKDFHKKGNTRGIYRWAILKGNHARHEIIGTYTHEQWVRAWGEGRM